MAELLIDVTRLADRSLQGRLPTGVDRVSLEYLRHFRERGQALVRVAGRWVVLGQADSGRVFDALLGPGSRRVGPVIRGCVAKGYVLAWKRPVGQVLINTGHSGLDRPDYARQVRRYGLQPVYFLHDLIPITHPEYGRPGEAERHRMRLATMVSTAQGIVVNSDDTQAALMYYARKQGWRLPPLAVAPLAPPRLPKPAHAAPFSHSYFVVLGTIEPRKNHLLLLHVWRELVAERGQNAPRLVLIGQRGWECEQVVDLLERCSALQGFVIELNRCSDAELVTWLAHARALLFPSFVEGYGMPLIEALMLGVPVIASDLPVFREIAGAIPYYLSPLDGLGWKQAILEYAKPDSTVRLEQVERMEGFVAPTWEAHFAVVDELIAWVGR
jgi:glycosyltransferase involved in cell wall biosynthesis